MSSLLAKMRTKQGLSPVPPSKPKTVEGNLPRSLKPKPKAKVSKPAGVPSQPAPLPSAPVAPLVPSSPPLVPDLPTDPWFGLTGHRRQLVRQRVKFLKKCEVNPNADGALKPLADLLRISPWMAMNLGRVVSAAFERVHGRKAPWIEDPRCGRLPGIAGSGAAMMPALCRGYRVEDLELIREAVADLSS